MISSASHIDYYLHIRDNKKKTTTKNKIAHILKPK